jgi:hypothetical protein
MIGIVASYTDDLHDALAFFLYTVHDVLEYLFGRSREIPVHEPTVIAWLFLKNFFYWCTLELSEIDALSPRLIVNDSAHYISGVVKAREAIQEFHIGL